MNIWFEVKIKYKKISEDGKPKIIVETYLFDGVLFADAEKRAYEVLGAYITDFKVESVKKANFAELFPFDLGDYWFKFTIESIITNDSGKEKKHKSNYLIMADSIDQALTRIKKQIDNMVVPYNLTAISLSNILDVFPIKED